MPLDQALPIPQLAETVAWVQAHCPDTAVLVVQARTTADLEQRQQLVLDAQRMVLEQAIWQPLLVRRITFAVDSTCVHGEQQSPAGALLFYNAQTAPW